MNLIEFEVDHKDVIFYYGIDLLPVEESLKTFTKLLKIGGEGMANIKNFDQEIATILSGILSRLDEKEVIDLTKILLKRLKKRNDKGEYIPFDSESEFRGKIGLLLRVLVEIIKLNYEDFFFVIKNAFTGEGTGAMAQALKAK